LIAIAISKNNIKGIWLMVTDASDTKWALWKIGLIAFIASAIANELLMLVSKSSLGVPESFTPLTAPPIIIWSFLGAFGAIGVYALIRKYSKSHKRMFNIVAAVVLVLSFIPDLAIVGVSEGPFAGATMAAAVILMIMHVISYAIVVPMLHSKAE
jgi:hypothetical protein